MNHDAPEDEAPEYLTRKNAPSEESEKAEYRRGSLDGWRRGYKDGMKSAIDALSNHLLNLGDDTENGIGQ